MAESPVPGTQSSLSCGTAPALLIGPVCGTWAGRLLPSTSSQLSPAREKTGHSGWFRLPGNSREGRFCRRGFSLKWPHCALGSTREVGQCGEEAGADWCSEEGHLCPIDRGQRVGAGCPAWHGASCLGISQAGIMVRPDFLCKSGQPGALGAQEEVCKPQGHSACLVDKQDTYSGKAKARAGEEAAGAPALLSCFPTSATHQPTQSSWPSGKRPRETHGHNQTAQGLTGVHTCVRTHTRTRTPQHGRPL